MPSFWPRKFSYLEAAQGLVKVHAVDKVPTTSEQKCDHRDYLALATTCIERMQERLESAASHAIHPKRCKYLVTKLGSALASLPRKPEHSEQCLEQGLEILKLLYRLAVEVESFVRECCVGKSQRELHGNKKHSDEEQPEDLKWHRTAITLANVSQRVSLLSYNLHFCTLLLRRSSIFEWSPSLTALDIEVSKDEVDFLNESTKSDQEKLLDATNTLLSAYKSNIDTLFLNAGYGLARHLLARLTTTATTLPSRQQQGKPYQHLRYSAYGTLAKLQGKGTALGIGANGEVKKVSWQGEDVALKQFSGVEKLPRFENEISILASLSHPSILSVLGYATEHQERIIILEFMNAGDLLKFMEDRRKMRGCNPPFTIFEAVDIMLQIGSGVKYLHENKVMHRDLKSTNVLVKCMKAEDDVEFVFAKVADFEQSIIERSSCTHLPMLHQKTGTTTGTNTGTTTGITTGTTRWMAPELLKDDYMDQPFKYDLYKSDVHSFGMVCYEILTGQVPFFEVQYKMKEVKNMIKQDIRPTLPMECPEDLKTLIRKCWHPIASARPSFTEICLELQKVKFALMAGLKFEDARLRELSKELEYLLKQNGGKMTLSKVPEEYNKQFGRNLSLPAYNVTKLRDLVEKMRDTLFVKDESTEKVLHLVQNTPHIGNKIKKRTNRKG